MSQNNAKIDLTQQFRAANENDETAAQLRSVTQLPQSGPHIFNKSHMDQFEDRKSGGPDGCHVNFKREAHMMTRCDQFK